MPKRSPKRRHRKLRMQRLLVFRLALTHGPNRHGTEKYVLRVSHGDKLIVRREYDAKDDALLAARDRVNWLWAQLGWRNA